jgi:hypothetical protein
MGVRFCYMGMLQNSEGVGGGDGETGGSGECGELLLNETRQLG